MVRIFWLRVVKMESLKMLLKLKRGVELRDCEMKIIGDLVMIRGLPLLVVQEVGQLLCLRLSFLDVFSGRRWRQVYSAQ